MKNGESFRGWRAELVAMWPVEPANISHTHSLTTNSLKCARKCCTDRPTDREAEIHETKCKKIEEMIIKNLK